MQVIKDNALLEKLSKKGLVILDKRSTEYKIVDGKTAFKHDGNSFQLKTVGKNVELILID